MQREAVRLVRRVGRIDDRLDELGLTLPAPLVPPGNFQLVKVHGASRTSPATAGSTA